MARGVCVLHCCATKRLRAAVTVVFGATGGIGAALAQRLDSLKSSGGSSQAPSAIILSADGEEKLKALQQQLKGVDVIPADARDPASVSHLPTHRHHRGH